MDIVENKQKDEIIAWLDLDIDPRHYTQWRNCHKCLEIYVIWNFCQFFREMAHQNSKDQNTMSANLDGISFTKFEQNY